MALEICVDPAGTRFAEISGEGEEGDQRAHCLRRVGVALHPKAGADGEGRDRTNELGESVDDLDRDVGDFGDTVGGVLSGHCGELVEAVHVGSDKGVVQDRSLDEEVGNAEGEGTVGPGADLDQQLCTLGRLSAPRIDDHHPSPALYCLLDEGHLVDIGFGRVLAPEDDQPRVDEIPGCIVTVVA